jgi:hypothetical protein
MGEKIPIVEDQKKERLVIATIVGMKKKKHLLMGSTKRKQQLFGMKKGRSSCCWGSIRLLRHILQIMQLKGPLM